MLSYTRSGVLDLELTLKTLLLSWIMKFKEGCMESQVLTTSRKWLGARLHCVKGEG